MPSLAAIRLIGSILARRAISISDKTGFADIGFSGSGSQKSVTCWQTNTHNCADDPINSDRYCQRKNSLLSRLSANARQKVVPCSTGAKQMRQAARRANSDEHKVRIEDK